MIPLGLLNSPCSDGKCYSFNHINKIKGSMHFFNMTDDKGLVDTLRMKNSCQQEINYLRERELECIDAKKEMRGAVLEHNTNLSAVARCERAVADAKMVKFCRLYDFNIDLCFKTFIF